MSMFRLVRFHRWFIVIILLLIINCSRKREIKPFTSDGCSLFSDKSLISKKSWCDCCFQHDKAYWRGGTKEKRAQEDLALKECLLGKTGDKNLAELMYQGVRVGGGPHFPTWYRWGYGWPYEFNYRPLTAKENESAQNKLDQYFRRYPDPVCQ